MNLKIKFVNEKVKVILCLRPLTFSDIYHHRSISIIYLLLIPKYDTNLQRDESNKYCIDILLLLIHIWHHSDRNINVSVRKYCCFFCSCLRSKNWIYSSFALRISIKENLFFKNKKKIDMSVNALQIWASFQSRFTFFFLKSHFSSQVLHT